MTVQLLLLKSGEDIIADVREMYNEEDNLIGYLFEFPCIVKLRSLSPENGGGYQIGLTSWMPLSKDTIIPVPLDWVVTMTTPIDRLMNMYQSEVSKRSMLDGQDNISTK
jgi:hypothetical protein